MSGACQGCCSLDFYSPVDGYGYDKGQKTGSKAEAYLVNVFRIIASIAAWAALISLVVYVSTGSPETALNAYEVMKWSGYVALAAVAFSLVLNGVTAHRSKGRFNGHEGTKDLVGFARWRTEALVTAHWVIAGPFAALGALKKAACSSDKKVGKDMESQSLLRESAAH